MKQLPDFKTKAELLAYANKHNMDFDVYHKLLTSMTIGNEAVSKKDTSQDKTQAAPVQAI